ncbi:hypothetical protein BGZ73_000591 [Actinomortierella ambigua]|nr:hypothetical protein BGZ73_000591 [Actinomortierella ambigua]
MRLSSFPLQLGILALGALNVAVYAADTQHAEPNSVAAAASRPATRGRRAVNRRSFSSGSSSVATGPRKPRKPRQPRPPTTPSYPNATQSQQPQPQAQAVDSFLVPLATDEPMGQFGRREHVVRPARLHGSAQGRAVPTNKFYGNLVLGDSHSPVWTHPYGLRWDSGGEVQQGIGISHIDNTGKAFGPTENGAAKFYINPFLVSMGLSATELNGQHDMTVGDLSEFSCSVTVMPGSERDAGRRDAPQKFIKVPMVRGMAFVTGIYQDLTPRIFSNIMVRTLTKDNAFSAARGAQWTKYRFLIEDGVTWLLYARSNSASGPALQLELRGQTAAVASGKFSGTIHIAKLPVGNNEAEAIYDASAGSYTLRGSLDVREQFTEGGAAAYKIDWTVAGETNRPFLHFTLPHHRQIMASAAKPTSITLPSTTKGNMVAYLDWRARVTADQLQRIREQTVKDINEINFDAATNLDSMYFAGKGLAKLGLLCLVASDALNDRQGLGEQCLNKLKPAFKRFMTNKQQNGLVYDTTWKGIISVQGLNVGPLADFGNSWYNDHHYHYGYFVHTGAIIRHLDPAWESQTLHSFVQNMLRDVMNPSTADSFFPTFRSFDWFMGHSWSQGIFVSADGKDEESTSEDINLYYAAGLWAAVNNNVGLQHLSETMLTIARRSIQNYFLLEDNNTNHPTQFVGNHVTGILFENKVDHATYFSPRVECIHGIQMIPATPALPMVRTKTFVTQEWNRQLAPVVGSIQDGWRSILMMNRGIIDKNDAWGYFAAPGNVPLDDGMTRTWALFYVASM